MSEASSEGMGALAVGSARSRTLPLAAPRVSTLAMAENSESALATASARPAETCMAMVL